MIKCTRERRHGCSVIQSEGKPKCLSQPLINAAHSIQLLMQNLILVPHFPFLNLLNVIQNGNLLLYSKCFLNARFQALSLLEEFFA